MTGQQSSSSSFIVAVETTWEAIRQRHPDVPAVIVTMASGGLTTDFVKRGHFAVDAWMRGEDAAHELFIAGEGLALGGAAVLATLLHEAAHGAALTRGVQDTSRQGRYHNGEFKKIAEGFGLAVERDPSIGWSLTTVSETTVELYAAEIARLASSITAHRRQEGRSTTRSSNNNGFSAECDCGRVLRVSRSTFAEGPITCGVCCQPFAPRT